MDHDEERARDELLGERRAYFVQPYYRGRRHGREFIVEFALGSAREITDILAGVAQRNERDETADPNNYEMDVNEIKVRRGKARVGSWVARVAGRSEERRGRARHR
ncbi:hypothetical protein [Micromonospora maritima]|uniref:hypothetical protein n=1 Tax=Micromonospora maritima TaxID=986711 RepID=UPI00157D4DB0|nr:hypothetical protein [Micromonospora maritima]